MIALLIWLIPRSFLISVLAGVAAFALFLVTYPDKHHFQTGAIIKTSFACLFIGFCTLATFVSLLILIGATVVLYITPNVLEFLVVNSHLVKTVATAAAPAMMITLIIAGAALAKLLFGLKFSRAICFALAYPCICSLLLFSSPNRPATHSARWFLTSTPLAICEEPLPQS